ncbi:hypothetical protein JG687_00006634 [Phytophthora cactorum]|uniref:Uncharacterized protein n=1 Tax=Phytophthora cactorum TaxID=29920 RepID=A0A8T1UKI5_9STRA|nr:hypothetical protein GQ600_7274 [Phytophthora cactorum]KAG6963321.1 hypothetical protein JG687_00006634 [Phytophthora cactorum]
MASTSYGSTRSLCNRRRYHEETALPARVDLVDAVRCLSGKHVPSGDRYSTTNCGRITWMPVTPNIAKDKEVLHVNSSIRCSDYISSTRPARILKC